MRHSIKIGLCFGVTSGIITTLGLMVGLHSSTNSQLAVLGGIIAIAIADALSDALGIHVSEESEQKHTEREIWEATVATFLFKFVFALTFVIPVLLFELQTAILVSVVWGVSALGVLSFGLAREQGKNPLKVISEHVIIALVVVTIAHYVGDWIAATFG